MKISCLLDTDTIYIEFRTVAVAASRDLDGDTLIERDGTGAACAMTIEHARQRAEIPTFSYERIAA